MIFSLMVFCTIYGVCLNIDGFFLFLSFLQIEMLTPKDYIGSLMELSQERRGDFKEMKFITENRASLTYEMPLAEVRFYYILY